jgi:hypothetical protein
MGQEFQWSTTLRKVFGTGAAALAVVVVAIQSVPVPEGVNEWADWKPWAMAVLLAAFRGAWNVFKTRDLPGNPVGGMGTSQRPKAGR